MLIPIPREAYLPLILLSLLAGILFGAVYDLFRIRRVAFRLLGRDSVAEGKGLSRLLRRHVTLADTLLCLAEDILFCLFATIVLILMYFKLYYGMPRWYAVGATILGFGLYHVTLGRLVIRSAEAVIGAIGAAVGFVRHRIVSPLFRRLREWWNTSRQRAVHKRELAYTKAEEARMLALFAENRVMKDASFNGNGKEKENKHEKDGSF